VSYQSNCRPGSNFVINLKTAKSSPLLGRADQVIE